MHLIAEVTGKVQVKESMSLKYAQVTLHFYLLLRLMHIVRFEECTVPFFPSGDAVLFILP